MLYTACYHSPLGVIDLFSNGNALTGLYLPLQTKRKILSANILNGSSLPVILQTKDWLDLYFSGNNPSFIPNLAPCGTPFQLEVWRILQNIPYGEIITYGDIARILAQKRSSRRMSAQAVGKAVGANPISIIIPCHRVVGVGCNLTGYSGGLDAKKRLLLLEGCTFL